MRLVVQRVTRAKVTVADRVVGETGMGLLVLVGFGEDDGPELARSPVWNKLLDKLFNLRIFPDDRGRFNHSLADVEGDLMLVSQFTLYADCRKGRRPSFSGACPPETAELLFNRFVEDARTAAPGRVETGEFGAMMHLDFTNWGPVTIILDSEDM